MTADRADKIIIPARRMAVMRISSLRVFSFCMDISLLCSDIKLHFIVPCFFSDVKPRIDFILPQRYNKREEFDFKIRQPQRLLTGGY